MKRYCRNCFTPLPKKANFCVKCGQKDSDGKVRMRTMLLKLWNTTFHLEGKFLRTCWQLFIPGKITIEFFKGKQGRYPHPLRMFAVVMFLFLFMFNRMLKEKDQSGQAFSLTTKAKTEHGDSVISKKDLPIYEKMKDQVMIGDMRQDFESLPTNLKTPASRKAVDSLLLFYCARTGIDSDVLLDSLGGSADTTNIFSLGDKKLSIASMDIVRYDADEIIQRYHVEGWALKLIVRQTIKSFKNPEGLVHAYIGSLTWAILALVTLMSALLALLYWRQKRYYVEHFIFLLHYHTGLMLAFLLGIIGIMLHLWTALVFAWIFLWATIAMFLAMRRYYRQGVGKTILKFLIFGFLYYLIFGILFIMGAVLVFAIY